MEPTTLERSILRKLNKKGLYFYVTVLFCLVVVISSVSSCAPKELSCHTVVSLLLTFSPVSPSSMVTVSPLSYSSRPLIPATTCLSVCLSVCLSRNYSLCVLYLSHLPVTGGSVSVVGSQTHTSNNGTFPLPPSPPLERKCIHP